MSRETGDAASSSNHGTTGKRQRLILILQPPRQNDALPEDLIEEILSMLPVKSLLRFRCVCKSWHSLISTSHFVNKHLHRSATDPNLRHHRFVTHDAYYEGNELRLSHSVRSLFDNPSSPSIALDANFECSRYLLIVGSCNGLVCWVNFRYNNDHYVRFLNPSTRLRSKSPRLRHPWRDDSCCTMFGFGYDPVSDSYKTVAIYCDPRAQRVEEKTIVNVYALGARYWRKIQSLPCVPRRANCYDEWCGKFVSGTLNWLAARPVDKSLLVVSVDLGKETSREVLLPDVVDQDEVASPKLWVLGGCLCFSYDFNGSQFVLWQMKQYGATESWTKLVNISYQDVGLDHLCHYFPKPVFMLEKGELLLQTKGNDAFILYNPRDNSSKYRQIKTYYRNRSFKNWSDPEIYIESLVSPCPSPC